MAEKYEEIYPNPCKLYVQSCKMSFNEQQLRTIEMNLANLLSFKLEPFPTPLIFLRRFSYIIPLTQTEMCF